MGIQVLGPLVIDGNDALARRDRVVLARLVLERGSVVSPDVLADALWADAPPPSAGKVVQGCIARLRRLLGAESIRTTDLGYVLDEHQSVDVEVFEAGVERGRELLLLGHADRAAHVLGETLAVWRAAPYPDLDLCDSAVIESARLDELHRRAEELHTDALLAAGDHASALPVAVRLADQAPLREVRWRQLALAAYRSGNQAEALAAIRRGRAALREELGLDPGPDLLALEARILQSDPTLLLPSLPVKPAESCPWPGLAAYDEGDADDFFGREDDLGTALAVLHGRGALAVVGPSGIGKSSFLRAGLVPALRRRHRVEIRTAGSPLAQPLGDCVLVVDQLEQLFAEGVDPTTRAAFVDALVRHSTTGLVVVALRADRVNEVAAYPDLAKLVERGIFLLTGLTEIGLRAAIERPAVAAGLHVEPGLVDLLVRDLEGGAGALPLLSHALVQTWERREGHTLTVDGYHAAGGVRGAVAQSAERMYGALPSVQQEALRGLMLRLVSPGPAGEPVASPVPSRTLDPATLGGVVEALISSRLVTSDDGVVTLAHEALTRAWPRLRGWLEDDVDGRRILHHLSAAAEEWEALGRPTSELYRGIRLARAVDWAETSGVRLSATETAFLEAGNRWAETEERSAVQRLTEQRRVNRRLRLLVTSLAVVVCLAVVAAVLAGQRGRRAEAAALSADARRVGAQALVEDDPGLAVLLAAASQRLDPSAGTAEDLQAALARWPSLVASRTVPSTTSLGRVLVDPGGSRLAVTDQAGHVTEWATADLTPTTMRQVGNRKGSNWPVTGAFVPQAGLLAMARSAGAPHVVSLLDADTLWPVAAALPGLHRDDLSVSDIAASADGRYLAAATGRTITRADTDGEVVAGWAFVWDLHGAAPRLVRRIPMDDDDNGVALSRDGSVLFTSRPDSAYDVATGRLLWQRPGLGFSSALAVDADGRRFVVPDPAAEGRLLVRDGRTGATEGRLDGVDGAVQDVAVSHDGRTAAAVGTDGLALTWDLASGESQQRIQSSGGSLDGVAFSADDRTLYTISSRRSRLEAWDLDGRRTFVHRLRVSDPVPVYAGIIRPSHDGDRVAVTQGWTPTTGNEVAFDFVRVGPGRTTSVRHLPPGFGGAGGWSPDDSRFAAGFGDGRVAVLDTATGRRLVTDRVLDSLVMEVGWSADGSRLVAVDDERGVVLLDSRTLEVLTRTTVPEKPYGVAMSPDGRSAYVVAGGTRWRPYWDVPIRHGYLVDLETGKVRWDRAVGLRNAIVAAFSPDGTRVAVGGRQGESVLLSAEDGRPVRPVGHANGGDIYWLAFDADGSRLVTASSDADAALWDGRTGALLGRARLPSSERLTTPGFRRDGSVVLASFSGNVYGWDPSADHAVAFACGLAGRDLTHEEWADAFPGRDYRRTCP